MIRRAGWLCMLLALAAAVLCTGALGEEIAAPVVIEEEMLPDVLPDGATLRDGYAGQVLNSSSQVGLYAYSNRSKLTETERAAYDALREAVIQIANGQRASAYIEVPLERMGLDCWYVDELDGAFFDADGVLDEALVKSAIREQMQQRFDPVKTSRSLMLDESFSFYWMDVRKAYKYVSPWNLNMVVERTGDGRYLAVFEGSFYYKFPVDVLFLDANCASDAPYTVDVSKTGAALKAVENAGAIVEQAAGMSDMARMTLYMQKIRELSSYNYDAVDPSYANSSPWQIVWVFDGDPETKVVCEGYSKAFQYLCNRTDFDDAGIEVYNVTGNMNGGAHMWNIVQYAGENYLVDVTNCNTDGGHVDSLFFSVPGSGDVESGYRMVRTRSGSSTQLLYVYNARSTSVYTHSELELSTTAPEDFSDWGCVQGLMWNLRKDGWLTVKGSGALAASAFTGRSDVSSAALAEGVTAIGAGAFYGCAALDTLCLPSGIGEIGASAFEMCSALEKVVYAGTRKEARSIAIGTGNAALENAEWVYEGDMPIDLDNYQVLYLPQNLESVEAEAFAGVAAEVVVLPEGEVRIGSRAFADCEGLLYVVVPEGTTLLAEADAFEGSDVIVISP